MVIVGHVTVSVVIHGYAGVEWVVVGVRQRAIRVCELPCVGYDAIGRIVGGYVYGPVRVECH